PALLVAWPVVQLAYGIDLRVGEAVRSVRSGRAAQAPRIERAGTRVIDLAVGQAVLCIALAQYGGVQRGKLGGGQDGPALRVGVRRGVPARGEHDERREH